MGPTQHSRPEALVKFRDLDIQAPRFSRARRRILATHIGRHTATRRLAPMALKGADLAAAKQRRMHFADHIHHLSAWCAPTQSVGRPYDYRIDSLDHKHLPFLRPSSAGLVCVPDASG